MQHVWSINKHMKNGSRTWVKLWTVLNNCTEMGEEIKSDIVNGYYQKGVHWS